MSRSHADACIEAMRALASVEVMLCADELLKVDAVSRLPAEYPGWMFEYQGAARQAQLAEGRKTPV